MRIYLIGCMPEGKNSDLEERIMKILLAAVNAKYIHSNLAVYSLKAYAEDPAVEIGEYTINQQKDDILMDIYKRQPDILCLSCYIWNLDYIEEIVLEIGKLRPDMPIWLGGPEVSYDAKEVLRRLPCVKGVMKGEGEKTFKEICRIYRNEFEKRENVCGYQDKNVDNSWKKSESVDNQLKGVDGITFREEKEKIIDNPWRPIMDLSEVPFVYDHMEDFEHKIEHYDIPSDGLVINYERISYGQSLGRNAKLPRDSIAFKWADELRETTLKEIEWSASRTGLINPVAIFEPVELEGTTVSRASVHNISILRSLRLGIGDHITVYKANMIIPQIAENLTGSDNVEIPKVCPVCGQPTEIRQMNEVQTLYCTNEKCPAKEIKAYTLFVSRDALNIDGLSEATLEKMIDQGFIHEYADLFRLDRYKEVITQMEGFGEKSYQNMIDSIEAARHTTLPRLIYGLGIAGIGVANAKVLCRYFDYDLEKMQSADTETLSAIPGVGEVLAGAFTEYMSDAENLEQIEHLKQFLTIEVPQVDENAQTLSGMSFVVTGSLNHYASRNDLKEVIEERGGKVTGSVTGKTTCLINNDITSTSSKNKKAKELQVPILTEEDFLKTYNIPYEE